MDFGVWEEISSLTIEEAACLWYEINPSQKDRATYEVKGNIDAMIKLLIEKTSNIYKVNFFKRNYGLTGRYGYLKTNPYTGLVVGFAFKDACSLSSKRELIDDCMREYEAIPYTPETKLCKESYREVATFIKEENNRSLPLFLSHGGVFAISDFKNYGLFMELLDKDIVNRKQDSMVMACFNKNIENEQQLKEVLRRLKTIGVALSYKDVKEILVERLFEKNIVSFVEGYIFYGSSTSRWDSPMYITFDDCINSEEKLKECLKQGDFGELELILGAWKRSNFEHTEIVLKVWREVHHGSIAFTREKTKERLQNGESLEGTDLTRIDLSGIDNKESFSSSGKLKVQEKRGKKSKDTNTLELLRASEGTEWNQVKIKITESVMIEIFVRGSLHKFSLEEFQKNVGLQSSLSTLLYQIIHGKGALDKNKLDDEKDRKNIKQYISKLRKFLKETFNISKNPIVAEGNGVYRAQFLTESSLTLTNSSSEATSSFEDNMPSIVSPSFLDPHQ